MADSKSGLVLAGKLLALALAAAISYLGLLKICLRKPDQHTYLAAQLDKMELLRTSSSPRVVLLGGSSLAFGSDSSALSAALRRPVVNMGLHGGLGLKYILDSASPLLRRGDLVVVVPEYEEFTDDVFEGNAELLELFSITRDPRIFIRLTPALLLQGNEAINSWNPRASAPVIAENGGEFVYTRDGFDRNGDEISHLGRSHAPLRGSFAMSRRLNRTAVQYLATFIASRTAQGVECVVVFPPLMRTFYQANRATIAIIENEIKRRVPQARALSAEEFVLDDQYFFDTAYHLNADGRKLRTEKVMDALNRSVKVRFWRQ